mgnify:CR=1 FL=1
MEVGVLFVECILPCNGAGANDWVYRITGEGNSQCSVVWIVQQQCNRYTGSRFWNLVD